MPRGTRGTRLASFPGWFFEIFDAAKQGKSYARTFPGKNFATAARHRWHSFRLELIAEGVPNADVLTEVMCGAPMLELDGKWSLTWTQTAVDIKLVPDVLPVANSAGGNDRIGALPAQGIEQEDAFTRILRERGYDPFPAKSKDAGKDPGKDQAELATGSSTSPATADAPASSSDTLDIPSLDLNPRGPELPPCPPHEPDAMGNFCIKCKLPWDDQWGIAK